MVNMPDVFDYIVSAGYFKRGLMANGFVFTAEDAGRRRHPPPGHAFISNHINFSKVGVLVMYPIPKFRNLAFQFVLRLHF